MAASGRVGSMSAATLAAMAQRQLQNSGGSHGLGGGNKGVQPAGLGSATCQAIQRRPSIGKNLVKIVLLDHEILENHVTLCKNVGWQGGWDIVVHGGRGGTGGSTQQSHGRAWVNEFGAANE